MFLKVLRGVTPVSFKNNLAILLGSKAEKFKKIETW